MKPTYTETSFPGILMNFRIPASLKSEFQEVCRNQHVSMTARLNLMIQEFLENQTLQPKIIKQHPDDTGDAWRNQLY